MRIPRTATATTPCRERHVAFGPEASLPEIEALLLFSLLGLALTLALTFWGWIDPSVLPLQGG